jgi:amino acid permease
VGAVLVLGLNLSAIDPILSLGITTNGPTYPGGFYTMIQRAGIRALPSIINGVMIVAVVAVANADLYVAVSPIMLLYIDG